MKKNWLSVIISLSVVLVLSITLTYFIIPLFNKETRIYSMTNCLTESLKEGASTIEIAKTYRDGNATCAVAVIGKTLSDSYQSLGSGVCIASKGYQTHLPSGYTASKGSYIVTNYHVIEFFYDSRFTSCQIVIKIESEEEYSGRLLWANKDLDIAIIYCEENFNYVLMKDRSLFCEESEKLDLEKIFTVGTPLDIGYLNRYTEGYVASNNPLMLLTTEEINSMYQGLSNLYEDVVDVSVGISPGNSGGGCFDSKGYLIGLTTLAADASNTNGNQMNGVVPIYPVTEVLDKIIDNNENESGNSIFTFDTLNIIGIDANEVKNVKKLQNKYKYNYYYFDGKNYALTESGFTFDRSGYLILSNRNSKIPINANNYITKVELNNKEYDIEDRNDLIYTLLQIDDGMSAKFYYSSLSTNRNYSVTVTF